jgi:hypothetical protein
MTTKKLPVIKCIGCKKKPEEISEYRFPAKQMEITPTEYVMKEEGTYDKFKRNGFYCTSCYIKAGCPTHNGRRQY